MGDVMTDVLVQVSDPLALASDTPAQIAVRHGGSGANTAAWLASCGVPTVFVGAVGDDAFGGEAARSLEAAGVTPRLAVSPETATGICVVLVGADRERTMLPDAGANGGLDPPDDVYVPGRHLHLSGYSLINPESRAAARAAIADAQSTGMTISVDAASEAPLRTMGRHAFLDATVEVDTLLVTRHEAAVLCDAIEPAAMLDALLVTYREVVLKLGADGAAWLSRSAPEAITVPAASPQGAVVDTAGAGDAFAAGWLAARRGGTPVPQALADACALAAMAVTRLGARPRGISAST